jgi:hypothetical protein
LIHEFANPIPVVVENGKDGYALYVRDGGAFENDIWCIVLCDGGHVRHYMSDQIRVYVNATLQITKENGNNKSSL